MTDINEAGGAQRAMKLRHLVLFIPILGVLVATWLMDREDSMDRARKAGPLPRGGP